MKESLPANTTISHYRIISQLGAGSQTQIVPPIGGGGLNPNTFTHDGSYVYYTRYDQENPGGTLYQIPVLGGSSKKVLTNITWPISLSPDGKQFAFERFHKESNEDELLLANADGTNERSLLWPHEGWLNDAAASWSPDGKMLAIGYRYKESSNHMVVAVVSVADGTLKVIPTPRWSTIGPIVWFSDGSGLALTVQEQESGKAQIWQLSYPGGEARRITNDLNSYANNSLTITADASALVAVQSELTSNIWVAPGGEASSARDVAARKNVQDGSSRMSWVPDGRIVYDTNINGKKGVWIVNADGGEPSPLTDSTANDDLPLVTSDGHLGASARFPAERSALRGPAAAHGAGPKLIHFETGRAALM